MGRTKNEWVAVVRRVSTSIRHQWKDDWSGLERVSYHVAVTLMANDGSRSGRPIVVWLTAGEARELGQRILKEAANAAGENQIGGFSDGS